MGSVLQSSKKACFCHNPSPSFLHTIETKSSKHVPSFALCEFCPFSLGLLCVGFPSPCPTKTFSYLLYKIQFQLFSFHVYWSQNEPCPRCHSLHLLFGLLLEYLKMKSFLRCERWLLKGRSACGWRVLVQQPHFFCFVSSTLLSRLWVLNKW